jgi:succinate dehydrogenase flavin-adding protein (antitoxin of CptAB toxin-antitoxin module)
MENIYIYRGSREFDNVIKTYYKKYGKHLQVDTMLYDKDSGKYYMYNDRTDYTLTTERLF